MIVQYFMLDKELEEANKRYFKLKVENEELQLAKWELEDKYNLLLQALGTMEAELDATKKTVEEMETIKQNLESQINSLKTDLSNKVSKNTYIETKSLTMKATAYTQSPEEGTADGITKTGTKVTNNRTVAVDPRQIPLGSLLYIESDSPLVGGFYVAEDIGGAIKDNRIDIFISDKTKAFKFGRQDVKVSVLKGA